MFFFFTCCNSHCCKCALFDCEAQSGSCPEPRAAETSPVKQELPWLPGKFDLQ